MQKEFKISIGVNAILAIAVAFLFFKVYSSGDDAKEDGDKKTTETTANVKPEVTTGTDPEIKTDPVKAGPLRIAYVINDSVSANYQFFIDSRKDLAKKEASLSGRIKSKYDEFLELRKGLELEAPTWTRQEQQDKAMKKLQEKEQEVMEYEQKQKEKMLVFNQEIVQDYLIRLETYLKKYAQESGYTYILSYTPGGALMHGDASMDVTEEVIAGLNAEYTAQ
jgi:outer membrane protein